MIRTLPLIPLLLTGPVFAQDTPETLVRFTGFLGDLRMTAEDVRADLSGEKGETRQIAIAMDAEATEAFTRFTTTHVNQSVTFFVCDQEVLTTTVQAPIDTGFALTGPLPIDTATAMVDALNGLGDCP